MIEFAGSPEKALTYAFYQHPKKVRSKLEPIPDSITVSSHMKKSLGARPLIYPSPVLIIGTYDKQGKPDVMTASWGGVASSQPPCVAISIRQQALSYQNLLDRKAFTISIPTKKYVKEVDYIGLVSGRTTDKFGASKLTAVKSKLVDAPYIKEFPLILECQVIQTSNLGMHTMFIGEVLDAKADEQILGDDGSVDIKKLQPLIYTPDTQEYYGIGDFIANVFSAGRSMSLASDSGVSRKKRDN